MTTIEELIQKSLKKNCILKPLSTRSIKLNYFKFNTIKLDCI